MSVRRADQEDQPSTSALPPTLFRLPDLDRPLTEPMTESAKVVGEEDAPDSDGDPSPNVGAESNGNRHLAGDHKGTVLKTAMSRDSLILNGADHSDVRLTNQSLATNPDTSSTVVESKTSRSDSSPADDEAADQPAGRGWMESFGSNRGIAVMLVLVFIAAWWTAPNYGSIEDSVSDGFAKSETALRSGSDDLAHSLSEGRLEFDLGERETAGDRNFARATPPAPTIVADSFGSAPAPQRTSSGPAVSVAMGTPKPMANFDANLFRDASLPSANRQPPTPPSLLNSRIDVQAVATPTSRDVLGNLEQMAQQGNFGVDSEASNTVTANRFTTEPASPTRPSTESPLGVDWSRYLTPTR